MTNNEEDLRRFLENLPDEYHILEQAIDPEIQLEYLNYSHRFGRGELAEDQTHQLGDMLFNSEIPIEGKKKALGLLAHLGTISAFRQIEKYCQHAEPALKQWSSLALQECRMFLESEIMDESTGFIVSGLGAVQDKLRFYFLMLPATESFALKDKNFIENEITLASKQLNSTVESFDFSDTYVSMVVLIPLDVAVATIIQTCIRNCNATEDIVFEHYYVTNQNIPEKAEIQEIIKIVKGDDLPIT